VQQGLKIKKTGHVTYATPFSPTYSFFVFTTDVQFTHGYQTWSLNLYPFHRYSTEGVPKIKSKSRD